MAALTCLAIVSRRVVRKNVSFVHRLFADCLPSPRGISALTSLVKPLPATPTAAARLCSLAMQSPVDGHSAPHQRTVPLCIWQEIGKSSSAIPGQAGICAASSGSEVLSAAGVKFLECDGSPFQPKSSEGDERPREARHGMAVLTHVAFSPAQSTMHSDSTSERQGRLLLRRDRGGKVKSKMRRAERRKRWTQREQMAREKKYHLHQQEKTDKAVENNSSLF